MFAIRRTCARCKEMAMLDLTALAASLSKISKDKAISSLSPALGSEAFIQPKYLATVCRHNSRSRLRAFSSSHSPDSISPEEDQLTKAKFVRFFAAIFMLTAGIRVAPHVAVNAVDHTIKLLDAEEEMLVSAGLSRLVLLLKMESAQKRAVESDVLPRLVRLIESASSSLSCDDGKNLSKPTESKF